MKLTEGLELRSETELVGDEDEPLGRVVCRKDARGGKSKETEEKKGKKEKVKFVSFSVDSMTITEGVD